MDRGRVFMNPYDSNYNIQDNSSLRRNLDSRQETNQSPQTSSNTRRFNNYNYNQTNISPTRPTSSSSSHTSSANDPRGKHIRFGSFNEDRPTSNINIKHESNTPSLTPINSYEYKYSNLENPDWPPNNNYIRENSINNSNSIHNQSESFSSNSIKTSQSKNSNRYHNSTERFNNFGSNQRSSNSIELDLINVDEFDAESLFDNDGDGAIFEMTQKPAQALEYRSNDKHQNEQPSEQPSERNSHLEYTHQQDKRRNDIRSNRNGLYLESGENKRAKHKKPSTSQSHSEIDLIPNDPEDLTENQIQDLLQYALSKNDSLLGMRYLNMLKVIKDSSNTPRPAPQQLSRSQQDMASSSNRREHNPQTDALKDALDRMAAKQSELDLLKAKVAKLAEELERERLKFLDMVQSVVPGGKTSLPDQVEDNPPARSSRPEKRRESSLDTRRSVPRSRSPEPPRVHQVQSSHNDGRTKSAQNAHAHTLPQQPKNISITSITSSTPKFTGFFIPDFVKVSKIQRVRDIKSSSYDDKLRFNPPYYKMLKQSRKCRSLILGNLKYPYRNCIDDIAITSCMNGIVSIYSGKGYDISTNIDLKEINYRWAEDICFIQPDIVAVLAYSDSMRMAPTPVSLLNLGNSSSKGPMHPFLAPIDIQTFTKPLSCIAPINLDDNYIEFVTGGSDHKVTIWKLPRSRHKSHISSNATISSARVGHTSVVNTVAFGSDMKLLYSGGADCKYFVTDPIKMSEVYSTKYTNRVNQIVVHPTIPQLQVVSFASENKQFQLLDNRAGSRKVLANFGFKIDKLLTKYAKHSINHRGNLVSCNDPTNNDILIWDLRYTKVDQEFQRYKSHDKKVNCVQFSPFKDNLVFSDENTQLGLVDFSF